MSEYSSSKHLDFNRCAERGLPLDAARMGEMGTQVQPKKRKRGKRNKNCLDGRSKESQVGKGDFVPINNVKNMESSTLRQQGESCGGYGSAGVDEIKIEKSKKRKRSSKNREGAEGAGIPDGVQKLERSIQEQRNSDHTSGGADGENDYKEEKSRKRKSRKRKKKGNQNDGDAVQNKNAEKLGCCNHHISELQSCILQEQRGGDVHAGGDVALELKTEVESKKGRKIEADGILINNVEKLESCFLMGRRGSDSNHTNADGLDATSNPVPNKNHQELEDGALELKMELKSKKKKRRSKKRKKIEADGVLINNVEKLESCFLMGQRGGDSNHTNADGLDATSNPVPNNNHQELEDGALELKTELKSKKKKRRSKKRRKIEADGVLINNVEKLGSSPMEQRGGDSKLTNADGLDPTRRPVPNKINLELEGSGLQEQIEHFDHSGANEVEIKPEVKSKRKKRRSKKKRQIELIVPPNDPPESGLPGKQGTFDSNHIGVGGLETKTEV